VVTENLLAYPQPGQTVLLPSIFQERCGLNQQYLGSLTTANLLRPYLVEAGLWSYSGPGSPGSGGGRGEDPSTWHGGWELLTCELRGHTLGHWLSAAAHLSATDAELSVKAAHVVSELARCQQANGGEWAGPFPENFLHRIAAGTNVWAPQYTLHKLLMGLFDMYAVAGSELALTVLVRFAGWFSRWTAPFTREQLDDVLDYETGGMLEVWANLYSVTGDEAHAELIRRYDRPRFFDQLLAGADVLTNRHANTQIPEILGAARAWEVTGDVRWRRIVEAFWRSAVTERGSFCTGGASSGEFWQPPFQLGARLNHAQEHCTVYNMMRLAETLYRWTGDVVYADYWERNLINGVLAQQHPDTGMVSYFLPLAAGSTKMWGTPTDDFWCCHGTLMQVHTSYANAALATDDAALRIVQYLPSTTHWEQLFGTGVTVTITQDAIFGVALGQMAGKPQTRNLRHASVPPLPAARPDSFIYDVHVACDSPAEFELRLRVPWWVQGEPSILVNGQAAAPDVDGGFVSLRRQWSDDHVRVVLPKALSVEPLPDLPGTVAFMDGPIVLAGLVDHEQRLVGDPAQPGTMLIPDQERLHSWWNTGEYRTTGQQVGFRFIPLSEVREESYSIYFPVTGSA
jgi:DUF1680 family protein